MQHTRITMKYNIFKVTKLQDFKCKLQEKQRNIACILLAFNTNFKVPVRKLFLFLYFQKTSIITFSHFKLIFFFLSVGDFCHNFLIIIKTLSQLGLFFVMIYFHFGLNKLLYTNLSWEKLTNHSSQEYKKCKLGLNESFFPPDEACQGFPNSLTK